MSSNLSSSLIGLSFLTGNASFASLDGLPTIETNAQRKAKAAFTTPVVTPPWKEKAPSIPETIRLSQILMAKTLIDKTSGNVGRPLPDDVQTSFTAFKALDKLKALATAAAKSDSVPQRDKIDAAFKRGLAELQDFLSDAPSTKVNLGFSQVRRRAESVKVAIPALYSAVAKGVSTGRDVPLAGLTGQEVFTLRIKRGTQESQINVDLATGPQPPTLDSVANLMNAAIGSIKMTDQNGNPVVDSAGNQTAKWQAKFTVTKDSGSWGFKIETPGGEQVSIDQKNAGDSLIVASGVTNPKTAESTRVLRLDDPATLTTRLTIGNLGAVDTKATAANAIYGKKPTAKDAPPPAPIAADFHTNAVVTANDGSTYTIGTTSGEVDGQPLSGAHDLVLTRMNSDGKIVWQQTLGSAADVSGAAISLAPNGDIVVAGTVKGDFQGKSADGDMIVSRFNAAGTELGTTLVRSAGDDVANAVTVGVDGSIYVAGRAGGASDTGGGDAYIVRLDAKGVVQERRTIDSGGKDGISALGIAKDGAVIALTKENGEAKIRRLDQGNLANDLGSYSLGNVDARVLAIGDDGSIAIGGATLGTVAGRQNNAQSGGRDGFVARIDADLADASVTYIGTGSDDQVDSVTFLNGDIYAGGRTKGALAGERIGETDGFVARLDSATGAIASSQQVGVTFQTTGAMHLAAAKGANTVLGALGLTRGVISGQGPTELGTSTAIRIGDSFKVQVGDGAKRTITIEAGETLKSLAEKVKRVVGNGGIVTTPSKDGKMTLVITPKPGAEITLIEGTKGQDALGKLGIAPGRILSAPTIAKNAPTVRPGGSYGLDLDQALDLTSKDRAKVAMQRIESALSVTQTAFRSLYWDESKAKLADAKSGKSSHVSPYQAAQLGRYQEALKRLGG